MARFLSGRKREGIHKAQTLGFPDHVPRRAVRRQTAFRTMNIHTAAFG